MDEKLTQGMSEQLNKELYSAYLYFAMSAYFMEINMEGFAKIIKDQAREELNHAKKIYNYLIVRDEKIMLQNIEAPDANWINPIDAIQNALNHEKYVTEKIHKLYEIARETKDYAGEIFLHWFIEEQVEEENKFRTLLEKMQSANDCQCEIMHIDRNLNIESEYVE